MDNNLFLSRHPQTRANRQGLVLGSGDSPLTAEGRTTFIRLMERIGPGAVEAIVSSPLPRALAGARLAKETIGGSIVVEPGLAELSAGQWEGCLRAELPLKKKRIRSDWTDRPPGGESYLDAETRLAPALENLASLLIKGPVLIVGHAVINRVLVKLRLGLAPVKALEFDHKFDQILLISPDGNMASLTLSPESRPHK